MARILDAHRDMFLAALAEGQTVTAAALRTGHHRSSFYELREKDADFAKKWDESHETGNDLLETEARRRAFEGVEKKIYYMGEEIAVERSYSDNLLVKLMQVRSPDRWGKKLKIDVGLPSGEEFTRRIHVARLRAGYPHIIHGAPTPEAESDDDLADLLG